MEKVKNIYYTTNPSELGGNFSTGLLIELENGEWLRHQTTDPILTFEPVLPPPNKDDVSTDYSKHHCRLA